MGTSLQFTLTMTADQYLHGILLREAVDAGPNSPLLGVRATLMPILRQWEGDNRAAQGRKNRAFSP